MHMCDIPAMVLLFVLFRPIHRTLALVALGFNLVQTCVLVANKLTLIAVTVLLDNPSFLAAFTPDQFNALVVFLLKIHNYGFALGLAFFGLAGLSYLHSSITLLVAPELSPSVAPVLVLSLLGELSFALWLVFKGVKAAEWETQTSTVEPHPGQGA